ncbi:MAG: DUF3696 domain-containing protein [Acidobacteriota bacterium]|nr:DUF3696 domain-containing protein [Blastocatellia bacterium]MDW8239207.1 DUF3696 domain-containing protein [Acidobacteriota bacterium]
MLTKLRIVNFKCLADTGELEIRPLTFLVGPNSSGKSSLFQALLALRQTVDSADIENPLAANDGWVKLGGYSDFVHRHETNRRLEFYLDFFWLLPEELQKLFPTWRVTSQSDFRLRVAFHYDPQTTQVKLAEGELSVARPAQFSQRVRLQDVPEAHYECQLKWPQDGDEKEWRFETVQPIKFYGFAVSPQQVQEGMLGLLYSQILSLALQNELQNLLYIGPLREYPQRVYVTSGQVPQHVGTRGERAVEVLWAAHRTERLSQLLRRVQDWVKEFGIASGLKLNRLGKTNHYTVVLIDPNTGLEVNLSDVGFGASQLVPIIVGCLYAPLGCLLLIEQPEIHLHPKAQAQLGDLFIEATQQKDRRVIIETHSEHILARVRRRIAEGKIGREDVAIYYFQPTPRGSQVREIMLNKYGQYEDFPEGFFEEDFEEAFAHLQAMRNKIKKESR